MIQAEKGTIKGGLSLYSEHEICPGQDFKLYPWCMTR